MGVQPKPQLHGARLRLVIVIIRIRDVLLDGIMLRLMRVVQLL